MTGQRDVGLFVHEVAIPLWGPQLWWVFVVLVVHACQVIAAVLRLIGCFHEMVHDRGIGLLVTLSGRWGDLCGGRDHVRIVRLPSERQHWKALPVAVSSPEENRASQKSNESWR
jgi:hypothetical protein